MFNRRDLLKLIGLGSAGMAIGGSPVPEATPVSVSSSSTVTVTVRNPYTTNVYQSAQEAAHIVRRLRHQA